MYESIKLCRGYFNILLRKNTTGGNKAPAHTNPCDEGGE